MNDQTEGDLPDDKLPGGDLPEVEVAKSVHGFEKTPMFTAQHVARYYRQGLIKEIEETQPPLLCYVGGEDADLVRSDIFYFEDMLHNVEKGRSVDLLLHTRGGDVDAAEKLINLVRSTVTEDQQLRVIVPDYAKSAGTLMALGANVLVVSDTSELGPIDPQWALRDGNDNFMSHSILGYLRAYELAKDDLQSNPHDIVARITFEKFDPAVAHKFAKIRDRVRNSAETLLIKRGRNFSKITSELMDVDKYPTHGQMIGWEATQSMGLEVLYMSPKDALWKKYWNLYCHLQEALGSSREKRIFESRYVSLIK